MADDSSHDLVLIEQPPSTSPAADDFVWIEEPPKSAQPVTTNDSVNSGANSNSNNFGADSNLDNFGTNSNNFDANSTSNTFGANSNANTFDGTDSNANTFGANSNSNTAGGESISGVGVASGGASIVNCEIPSITIFSDSNTNNINPIVSTEKPIMYPDSKDWANSEYTESSRADEDDYDDIEDDDGGSTTTTVATSVNSDAHVGGARQLASHGVRWPASAVVDGTIDPTTATIFAAVRAVTRVADEATADGDTPTGASEAKNERLGGDTTALTVDETSNNLKQNQIDVEFVGVTGPDAPKSTQNRIEVEFIAGASDADRPRQADSKKKLNGVNGGSDEDRGGGAVSANRGIDVEFVGLNANKPDDNNKSDAHQQQTAATTTTNRKTDDFVEPNAHESSPNETVKSWIEVEFVEPKTADLRHQTDDEQRQHCVTAAPVGNEVKVDFVSSTTTAEPPPSPTTSDAVAAAASTAVAAAGVSSYSAAAVAAAGVSSSSAASDAAADVSSASGTAVSAETQTRPGTTTATLQQDDRFGFGAGSNVNDEKYEKNVDISAQVARTSEPQIGPPKSELAPNELSGVEKFAKAAEGWSGSGVVLEKGSNSNNESSKYSQQPHAEPQQSPPQQSQPQAEPQQSTEWQPTSQLQRSQPQAEPQQSAERSPTSQPQPQQSSQNSISVEFVNANNQSSAGDINTTPRTDGSSAWMQQQQILLAADKDRRSAESTCSTQATPTNANLVADESANRNAVAASLTTTEQQQERSSILAPVGEKQLPAATSTSNSGTAATTATNSHQQRGVHFAADVEDKQQQNKHDLSSSAPPHSNNAAAASRQPENVAEDYSEAIDEYERNLRRHTCETLELVDRLCEKSQAQQQPQQQQQRAPTNPLEKSPTNPFDTLPSAAEAASAQAASAAQNVVWNGEIFSGGAAQSSDDLDLDVDSLRINPGLMADPVDCLLFADRRLAILDNQLGVLVVDLATKAVTRSADAPPSTTTKWRSPQCVAYVPETDHLLVLAECCSVPKAEEADKTGAKSREIPTLASLLEPKPTDYVRYICRFEAKTLRLVERVEAPKFIRDMTVLRCQLCHVPSTKCVYLAVSTPNDAFLYELTPDCRWSEVYNRRGRTFSDLQYFAVIGPVTELLVLETNKQHVLMISIYESLVVGQRMVAVTERPAAIAVDEHGAVFAFDRASARVAQHSRLHFERQRDIALVERAECRISAQERLLAVLVRGFKQLKLYKY